MGDIDIEQHSEIQNSIEQQKPSISNWSFGTGEGTWQSKAIKDRTSHLLNNSEMSDILINACDENWWYGDTVRDFNAHRFLLGTASPVFHKILYSWEDDDNDKNITETNTNSGHHQQQRKLLLSSHLEVSIILVPYFDYHRLEIEGIPPIAVESLLEYIYEDKFNDKDFENGYSRNLLWRLWHGSRALEMEYLHQKCTETIHATMSEETVFWDLNYAIKYKSLGTEEIQTKVLKHMEGLEDKLFHHPNFVWLDHASVNEILNRRESNSNEPLTIYNNLLRWSLYQIDRSAVCETEEGLTGAEIPIQVRLAWISDCRKGIFEHINILDLDKYLSRGLEKMPWTEMSQSEFLEYVTNAGVAKPEVVFENAIKIMEIVVSNPERLHRSAYAMANHIKYTKEKSKISVLFNSNNNSRG